MRTRYIELAAGTLLAILWTTSAARADTLLHLPEYNPRVYAGYVSVNYSLANGATVGLLTATGYAETYTLPGASTLNLKTLVPASFTLTAHVNTAGHALDGSLRVTGVLQGETTTSNLF